jgi:hypothetical protein
MSQDQVKMVAVEPSSDELVEDQVLAGFVTNTVPGSPRISSRRARRDTRLASNVYPMPVFGTDDPAPGQR